MSRSTTQRVQLASFEEMLGGTQIAAPTASPASLPIDQLKPYPNHKYKLYTGDKLAAMVESITEHGILQPIIVWLREGEHIILAGHNRVNAAKIAGLTEVPVMLKENLTEDEARFIVNETNLKQRSFTDLTHSQRAAVLADHYAAIKAKGKKQELIAEIDSLIQRSSVPVGNARSIDKTCINFGLSQGTVARYLRIALLIPEFSDSLDSGKISIRAAVDLSWIAATHQKIIAELMTSGCKVEMCKAQLLRQQAQTLTAESIKEILMEKESPVKPRQVTISQSVYTQYLQNQSKKEVTAILEKALASYFATDN